MPEDGRHAIEQLESRRLMAAAAALWVAGGGAYLTELNPATGSVLATVVPPAGTGTAGVTADAADPAGNLFVIDAASGDVLRVDAVTHAATVFVPAGTGGLTEPDRIAVGRDGTVVVINTDTAYAFSPAGVLTATATTSTQYAGVVADPQGNVVLFEHVPPYSTGFTDYGGQEYAPRTLSKVGLPFAAGYDGATYGLTSAFDYGADGKLYHTSTFFGANTTTVILAPQTTAESDYSVELDDRRGSSEDVAVDAVGNLYWVTDTGSLVVRSAGTDGTDRHVASPASGAFDLPLYVPTALPLSSTAFDARQVGRYAAAAGTVTVHLSGPGTGEIEPDSIAGTGFELVLSGTTSRSAVTVSGPAAATLDGVESAGDLGSLLARRTTLAGDVTLGGTSPTRLAFGAVAAGSSLTAVGSIASLSVDSWAQGTADDPSAILAASVGVLRCRGAFSADVTLTAAGQSLARAAFGSVSDASLDTAGSVGSIAVAGDVADSRFEVDATALPTTPMATFGDGSARLGRFVQRASATFDDSQIAAYAIGTVSLGTATGTDAATTTGVAGHTIGFVRVPPVDGGRTLRRLDGSVRPQAFAAGDVVVQVT